MTTKNFVVKNGLEAGNITLDAITNIITTTGNVSAANILTGGIVSATGNITGNNFSAGNLISAGGNITGANILTIGNVSASGAVLGSNVYVSSLGSEQIAIAFTGGQLVGGIDLRWEFSNAALWATNIKSNGYISTSGNITGANLLTSGAISTSGNINANNLTTTGNISANNATVTGILSVSGNLDYTGANAYFSNVSNIKIPGGTANYVLTTDGSGNVSWQPTGQGNANVAGNNTEVQFNDGGTLGASANFTFNKSSNTLTATFIAGDGSNLTNIAGANVTGTVANATHASTANVVTDGTQSNITAVGTLTSVSVIGDANTGNVYTGIISASGNLTAANANLGNLVVANFFQGDGNNLSNIQASNVSGTVANANYAAYAGDVINANQANITSVGTLTSLSVSGNIDVANANLGNAATANFFIGNGDLLSALNFSNITFFNTAGLTVDELYLQSTTRLNVTASGASGYIFDQYGAANINPVIYVTSGQTLAFNLSVTGHPFLIQTGAGANYDTGLEHVDTTGTVSSASSAQGKTSGTLYWKVPYGITGNYKYQCSIHGGMNGNIVVSDANVSNLSVNLASTANSVAGANVTGTVANATHAATANTVVDGTQSNITSVGTLTNLSISGNANIGNNVNVSGNAVITGNLVVGGNTVYVNVETIRVEDPIIELGGGPNGDPLTTDDGKDRGTLLHYYSGAAIDAFMGWDASNGEFALGSNVSVTNEVVTFNTLGNLRVQSLTASTANFSGNIGAGNANLGNIVSANFFIGSGANLSNINAANITGIAANANYANFAGTAFNVSGSNVSGEVANANYASFSNVANTANSVAGANVSGTVANANYATYSGTAFSVSGSNVSGEVANANYATYSGTAFSVSGSNVSGTVANANYATYSGTAASANSVAGANVSGEVANANYATYSGTAFSVSGSNVSGTVANANYATYSGTAASANSVAGANVTGTVANANYAAFAGNVVTASQSNITSLGTLTGLTVGPNSSVILSGTSGFVKANSLQGNDGSQTIYLYYGNVSGAAGVVTDLTVGASGTGNLLVSGTGNVTGNLRSANANLGNLVTANYFQGDGGLLSNISISAGSYIVAGTSNVHLDTNGNLHVDIAGNTDKLVVTGTGANVNGYLTVSGNLESGNANLGNAARANFFIGSGNNLSNIQAANVSGLGNIATVNLDGNSSNVLYGNGTFATAASPYGNSNVASFLASYGSNTLTTTGNVSVGNIIGNGQALTGVNGANVTGTVANANYAAYAGNVTIAGQSNITSVGTLSSLSVSSNINSNNLNTSNIVSATGNIKTSGFFVGDGGFISNISVAAGSYIVAGTSNVHLDNNGNLHVDIAGNVDKVVVTGTGANVNGYLTVSGNLESGNANLGNAVTANFFIGSGNNLSNIQVANVTGLGNIATLNLDGNASNVLYGNGVFAPAASPYGNSNVASFLTSYGSNTITTTGNVTVGNIIGNGQALTGLTGANVTGTVANANYAAYAGNVTIAGQSNITSLGTLTSVSVSGNTNVGNLNTGGVVSATGNVTGNYILGNGAFLTGITTGVQTSIANGNSNVSIPAANGNVNITAVGNANIVVVTGTGANINGYANITGNANIGNIGTEIITASGNVTGANLLTNGLISATGNLTANNVNVGNIISAVGNITGNYILGNGAYLTGVSTSSNTIFDGNSNVFVNANSNIDFSIAGNTDVVVFTGTGANINGYANITGNANIGNIGTEIITATGNVNGNNLNASNLVSTTDLSASGNAVISGNLTVSGTTEYINVTNLAIKDPIISIGRGANNDPLTTDDGKDRGEQLWYYSGSEKSGFIGYDNSAGKIIAAKDVSISSEVVTVNTYGNFVVGGLEANTVSAVGNIATANSISATGNIETANYILGNGYYITGIATGVQDKIANGNSNVYIPTANGNVTITAVGNANVVVITGTGANITGTANISGNITTASNVSATGNITGNVFTGNGNGLSNLAGANVTGQVSNALVAGTVYTAAQPNITSVGTLTGLTVGPNSSVILSGTSGFVRANSIQGRDGSQAIYPYYQNVSGAVGIVTDLTVGASGGGNLTVANGNVAFSGSNVSLGDASNVKIIGGTLNYFLKTDGSGNLSWALPAASPGGSVTELQFNNTGVFGGTANLEYDSAEYRLSIQNYSLTVQALGGISGATTINVTNGCYVTATSAGITTWIFTFPAPVDNACGFVLELTNGGTYTQNWPLSVRWPGGSPPDLTATGVDILVFVTNNNGTTWRGAVSMLNST